MADELNFYSTGAMILSRRKSRRKLWAWMMVMTRLSRTRKSKNMYEYSHTRGFDTITDTQKTLKMAHRNNLVVDVFTTYRPVLVNVRTQSSKYRLLDGHRC
jgi:hypothetical protein